VQKVAVEKSRLRELLVENGWAPHRLRVMSLHELRTAASQIGSEREERK